MPGLTTAAECNQPRLRVDTQQGGYESFFLRANHPSRPVAFWIRYTLFVPRGRPDDAVGERWAIYFDGESGRHVAAKDTFPVAQCRFGREGALADIGGARLGPDALRGEASGPDGSLRWTLSYAGEAPPLCLLPRRLYEGSFPRAKALVGVPLARFDGQLEVAGKTVDVDGWVGSQNHNWGERHTDAYAWGQVAGFDGHPESFLEVSTARVKVGPLWTPFMSIAVLRHAGREYLLNGLLRGALGHGRYGFFDWTFAVSDGETSLSGRIEAPAGAFVALRYDNPPGGDRTCLNSKIASATLALQTPGAPVVTLSTAHRAAFEMLTDDPSHGLPRRV